MTKFDTETADRVRRDLDALVARDKRLGIAVSGGPDSLALLLLAAEARPGQVEAATVDHRLRPESALEAATVAELCAGLGVPHATLSADWGEVPTTAIQERARALRYRLLGDWARERGLRVVTAHHLDDQAETLLMRLSRGAGVKGLAGMRRVSDVVRPLLSWRKSELEAVCAAAEVVPLRDPSNEDEQFERVRVREALGATAWLDPAALASSAAHLAQADEALEWAVDEEWQRAVTSGVAQIIYRPADAPPEIRRRIVRRAVLALATEGKAELRGRELDGLLASLASAGKATLRGVLCSGGAEWRFARAPQRKLAR
jgi:tRNA(Ile)-lysidine synthase